MLFFNIPHKVLEKIIFIFPIFTFSVGFAQNAAFRESKVPYEIKFVDVIFHLNEVMRLIMSQELVFAKNKEIKSEYLKKVALVFSVVEPFLKNSNVPNDFKYLPLYGQIFGFKGCFGRMCLLVS